MHKFYTCLLLLLSLFGGHLWAAHEVDPMTESDFVALLQSPTHKCFSTLALPYRQDAHFLWEKSPVQHIVRATTLELPRAGALLQALMNQGYRFTMSDLYALASANSAPADQSQAHHGQFWKLLQKSGPLEIVEYQGSLLAACMIKKGNLWTDAGFDTTGAVTYTFPPKLPIKIIRQKALTITGKAQDSRISIQCYFYTYTPEVARLPLLTHAGGRFYAMAMHAMIAQGCFLHKINQEPYVDITPQALASGYLRRLQDKDLYTGDIGGVVAIYLNPSDYLASRICLPPDFFAAHYLSPQLAYASKYPDLTYLDRSLKNATRRKPLQLV